MIDNSPLIFKKWRRNKSGAGFASFYNWTTADRVKIEIADVNPANDSIKSLSTCYVPTGALLSYLHAETFGIVGRIYPSLKETGKGHGLTFYGGKKTSRVFKIEDWGFNPAESDNIIQFSNARRFKCGEFELKQGTRSSEPDYSKRISLDSIQMKPEEISQLYLQLQLSQQAFESAVACSRLSRDEYIEKLVALEKEQREAANGN